jgi:hypothetical protein
VYQQAATLDIVVITSFIPLAVVENAVIGGDPPVFVMPGNRIALHAGHAVRVPVADKPIQASVLVREVVLEILEGILQSERQAK